MSHIRKSSLTIFYITLVVLCSCYIGPAAAENGETAWSLERLYSDPPLLGSPPEQFHWCGDNRRLAFLWNEKGEATPSIWLYSTAAGSKQPVVPGMPAEAGQSVIDEVRCLADGRIIFAGDGRLYLAAGNTRPVMLQEHQSGISQLSLSPEQHLLAYLVDGQLWIRSLGDRKAESRRLVSTVHERVSIESYRWSPDSKRLAFIEIDNRDVREIEVYYHKDRKARVHRVTRAFPGDRTPGRRVGVTAVSNGQIRWLDAENPRDKIWGYGWSADSASLFVDNTDFLIKQRNIFVYDVASGKRQVHYSAHDSNRNHTGWSAAWAPDDQGMVILSDRDGYYHLYHQPQAGAALVALTSGKWEVADFIVDSNHKQIHFIANREHVADRQLYRVAVAPGAVVTRISNAPGTYEPVYSRNFSQVAYRFSDDHTPADLYLAQTVEKSQPAKITHSPSTQFTSYAWAEVKYVKFNSHIDGVPLVGRLYLPPDFNPTQQYPLVVGSAYRDTVRNQWGGSQNAGGNAPHPTWGLDQLLVARGYLVFNVNVRGSWGHGRAFREALKEYGSIEVDDIESGVRHLVTQGFVDPERVGIWGLSYGGLMTTMSLFKKPGVYAAGVAVAPATNVWHAYPEQMWVMGEPHGNDYPGRYERQSALYQSSGLQDPLMLIHGTRDIVVLYSDTIALAENLIAENQSFELVTLPGAKHPIANDSIKQTRFAFGKILNFFDRHLKP